MRHSEHSLKQPKELVYLFLVEMWERFAYYGMQVILIFFLLYKLNFDDSQAIQVNAAFMALVYATPSVGGYVADNIFGIKRSLILGAIFLILGYFFLGIVSSSLLINYLDTAELHRLFYISLGFIVVGNGFFKPNPTTLLSKVYKPNDPRIDSGYTIFYMSINIGGQISEFIIPVIKEHFGFSPAFFICALGLVIGLTWFITRLKHFKNIGSPIDFIKLTFARYMGVIFVSLFVVLAIGNILISLERANIVLSLVSVAVIFTYLYFSFTLPGLVGKKVLASFYLVLMSIVFFAVYAQIFGAMNIFIYNNVDRVIFGYTIPAETFAVINPIWIVLLSPFFAKFYLHMEKNNKPISIPLRFSIGLVLASCSFLIMPLAAKSGINGIISPWWIVLSYFFISSGELLVSALGLAMVCRLAPPKMTSYFMGGFLLSTAIGTWLSGMVGKFINTAGKSPVGAYEAQYFLDMYTSIFFKLGLFTFIMSILAILVVPYINRLIDGEDK